MTVIPAGVQTVLDTWFGLDKPGPRHDALVREALGNWHRRAMNGELDDWADHPRARLALVLLLDQVPRHIFRDTAQAHAGDARAQVLTALFLERDDWAGFSPLERYYAAAPWLHAEDADKQARILPVMHALAAEDPAMRVSARVADLYLDTIRRFGRFPHRNAALGRASTTEELAFLAGEWAERRRATYRDPEE
jgi:uncharacterized protein (DUF924 family)